jgi:hypothetical protein
MSIDRILHRRVVRGRRASRPARLAAVAVLALMCTPLGCTAASGGPVASRAAAAAAQVTIVHGLRGKLVDVYVDGALLLPAFEPDKITDPTAVAAGPHKIELRDAGAAITSTPNATATADLAPGSATTIVAYFGDNDTWTVATYPSVEPAPSIAGRGRLVFRNNSSAGPVDISVDGALVVQHLVAPLEAVDEVGARPAHRVEVRGSSGVVVPADDVEVTAGRTRILYLVGSGSDLTWLTQEALPTASRPSSIATGNSGLAASAPSTAGSLGGGTLLLAGVVAVATLCAAASTRRRSARTGRR